MGTGTGKRRVPVPVRRLPLSRNAAAAIFVKYGFDVDGLLPYDVFVNALTSAPARLLGFEASGCGVEDGN